MRRCRETWDLQSGLPDDHVIGKTSGSSFSSLKLSCFVFSDPFKGDDRQPAGTDVHIRIQQRNGRKTLTTVQGIDVNYDKKKLVKAFKKVRAVTFCRHCFPMLQYSYVITTFFCPHQRFACNGTVIDHPEYGEVIQVQGDQRSNIRQFIKEVSRFVLSTFNHRVKFLTTHCINCFSGWIGLWGAAQSPRILGAARYPPPFLRPLTLPSPCVQHFPSSPEAPPARVG